MAATHAVPNQVTVRTILADGHRAVQCAVVSRDRVALAFYPAEWPVNRKYAGPAVWVAPRCIPSITEVQRDARWQVL